jgi:hypothetical protein
MLFGALWILLQQYKEKAFFLLPRSGFNFAKQNCFFSQVFFAKQRKGCATAGRISYYAKRGQCNAIWGFLLSPELYAINRFVFVFKLIAFDFAQQNLLFPGLFLLARKGPVFVFKSFALAFFLPIL